ncbi:MULTISPECIES: CdaR family transcriptional regulator [Virgibacillus]|uniref:CdaR family transcriptional regulator n=1 Tax=Virgibacillus TaxID=84406 RepID=UPI0003884057|nr:sugar diacid recognition domain-containing protein [Virgibacillus sp. CM-4]EQB36149.1 hypothetical protein M948_14020 [Virgibacillus sp. CM-4]MYL42016.1 hypothetical protein [Virgibacillus massiliensis]
MERFVQFAQQTVKTVSKISPFPISLSDRQGYIIGDTNSDRIGKIHKPSVEVIKLNKAILFDDNTVSTMENVLPGIALPLCFEHQTAGVLGIIGDPHQVMPYAELIKNYVETMWHETIHSHIEELESKITESFIQYILLENKRNIEKLKEYCSILHMEYLLPRCCIVIDIGNSLITTVQAAKNHAFSMEYLRREILYCIRKAYQAETAACAFLNPQKIVLLKAINDITDYHSFMADFKKNSLKLMEMLNVYHLNAFTVAVGNKYESMDKLCFSYEEAENLIKLGKQTTINPAIYSFYDWNVLAQLFPFYDTNDIHSIIQLRLRNLYHQKNFLELKQNFLTYCDCNLNLSKAAKLLFIHRNTLIYRLNKIEALTQIDLGCFAQSMLLYVLLKRET